jgi:hypothetical protein
MLLTVALHKRNQPLIGADDRVEGFSVLVGLGFRATFVDSPLPPLYFLVDAVTHEPTSRGHSERSQTGHKQSSRVSKIGVLQEQMSELLVRAHQLSDVVLDFETGMNGGPIMCSSDKCEKRE